MAEVTLVAQYMRLSGKKAKRKKKHAELRGRVRKSDWKVRARERARDRERGKEKKTFKVTLVLYTAAAKHSSVQCCSTFIAQTNFTRGINMAEILGFYDLLHSAGGCVSGVMCSDRLDLNSADTEKETEKRNHWQNRKD